MKRVKAGDVTKLTEIRQQLKCKNFDWFLKNIFPESVMLGKPKKMGQIHKLGSKYCLDKLGRELNSQIGVHSCHGSGYTQGFCYQKNHQIAFHPSWCLGLAKPKNIILKTENVTLSKKDMTMTDENLHMSHGTKENITILNQTALLLNIPKIPTPEVNATNHVVFLECNSTSGEKWLYDESVSI